MPNIRPVTDLRNNFAEISRYVHETKEPVFLTKNGHGDMAVLSMDSYEHLISRLDFHEKIDEGLAAIERGEVIPADEAFSAIRKRIQAKNQNV